MRLNIAAGTGVRFEPGEEKEIELTDFGGRRVVHGFHGLVGGALDSRREQALEAACARAASSPPARRTANDSENSAPHLRRSLRPD